MYTTFVYGVYYIFLTSMSQTFEDTYGFGRGVIGLAYIGLGIGAVVGMLICGHASDVLVRRMSKDGEIKPEHRLPPIIPGSVFTPIGLLWFGWSVMGKVHWIVPIIGTVWIGVGNAACFVSLGISITHSFTLKAKDAFYLHDRRIPEIRSFCYCGEHCHTIRGWCSATTRRAKFIRKPRARLGKLATGFHLYACGSDDGVLVQVQCASTSQIPVR
jgi:hypothetical protein